MVKELVELYQELTETEDVRVELSPGFISITIISNWFDCQSESERMLYLLEGIEVVYPHLLRRFRFQFIALTPRESALISTQTNKARVVS